MTGPDPDLRQRAHNKFDEVVYGFTTTLDRAVELIAADDPDAARLWLEEARDTYRAHLFAGEA